MKTKYRKYLVMGALHHCKECRCKSRSEALALEKHKDIIKKADCKVGLNKQCVSKKWSAL